MLPILWSAGPFHLRTINLFLVLAFFVSGFFFWRKSREEHYEEDETFDGFLVSMVASLVIARIGFVVTNFGAFGWDVLKWLDLYSHPGFSGFFGIIGSLVVFYRFAQKRRWDGFEILDFWVTALSAGLSIFWLGSFFDGSGFGKTTNLPWGMVFPGVFDKHHPNQLYLFVVYLLLAWYLSYLEYHYRTFEWYKAKRKSAQTGFLVSVFLIIQGIIELVFTWLSPAAPVFFQVQLGVIYGIVLLVGGGWLMLDRSGRTISLAKKES